MSSSLVVEATSDTPEIQNVVDDTQVEESEIGSEIDALDGNPSTQTPIPYVEVGSSALGGSSSSSSSSFSSCSQAVQTERLSSLIERLRSRTDVLEMMEDAEKREQTSPFFLLGQLFGQLPADLADALSGVVDVRNHDALFKRATNVLAGDSRRVFSRLDLPEDTPNALHNDDFADELKFLENSDVILYNRPFVIPTLLVNLSTTFKYDRRLLSAQLIMFVHVLKAIIGNSKNFNAKELFGTEHEMYDRLKQIRAWKECKKNRRHIGKELLLGKFTDEHKGGFIYELVAMICFPLERFAHKSVVFTNAIFEAEYHSVRCAIDASNHLTLFFCPLSYEYIDAVWLPYMRFYYPRMFNSESKEGPELTWTTFTIYPPSIDHMITPVDHEEMAGFMTRLFSAHVSELFRQSILVKNTGGMSQHYIDFVHTVFTGPRGVRPKRASSIITPGAYKDRPKGGSKKKRS